MDATNLTEAHKPREHVHNHHDYKSHEDRAADISRDCNHGGYASSVAHGKFVNENSAVQGYATAGARDVAANRVLESGFCETSGLYGKNVDQPVGIGSATGRLTNEDQPAFNRPTDSNIGMATPATAFAEKAIDSHSVVGREGNWWDALTHMFQPPDKAIPME
jgi:hypothetical protein